MTDETQVWDGDAIAAEAARQLGPRTTTHATDGAGGVTPTGPFYDWVAKWVADHVPEAEQKARQYGSNSLAKKGYRFAAAQRQDVSTPQALELGAAQYVMEKLDRVEDAVMRGQLPSDDTWVDVAVYALMIGYIRQNGCWL